MQRFDPTRMYELFDALNLPARTRELIVGGFRRPVREVGATRYRAPSDLCCPKMGCVIHAANALERKAVLAYQFDPDVLGYLDSPFVLPVSYLGRGRRPVTYNWEHGFLVMTAEGMFWDDWYYYSKLIGGCKSNPSRFVRCGETVRSPPFEEAAEKLGIRYRLRSDRELDPMKVRNLEYLRPYLVDEAPVSGAFLRELKAFFEGVSYATLGELTTTLDQWGLDMFHAALAAGDLAIDLSSAFVGDHDRFIVFRDDAALGQYRACGLFSSPSDDWDPQQFRPGTRISMAGNPFTVLSVGTLEMIVRPDGDDGQLVNLRLSVVESGLRKGTLVVLDSTQVPRDPLRLDSPLRTASERDVRTALLRLSLLARWERGDPGRDVRAYSDRTYRTWRRLRDDAIAAGIDVVPALLPRTSRRGNRNPRLDPELEAVIQHFIRTQYESLTGRSQWSVYGSLSRELLKTGRKVSKPTFLARVKAARTVRTTEKREGWKAAYQERPFYWHLDRTTPVHGDFPMQWVHIDHTELEIEVIEADTGESLGRPILTVILCAYSRRVVGFFLSLLSPRYISCMAAVLDMIRRTGRAPVGVIFDGGSEFGALDFLATLAFLRIDTRPRKTSSPREGCLIERLFEITQSMLIHNLQGSTKLRRNVRMLTPEVNPSGLAIFTLQELYDGLEEFFFDTYDTRRHPALLMSPRQMYERGLDRSGKRLSRLRRLEDCVPHAFPSVRGRCRTIDAQRGVRTNYANYRNPLLESAMFDGLKVPTKYHPLTDELIYVYVRNEWLPMYKNGTGDSANAAAYYNMAHLEEQRVLQVKVLASHADANMAVAALQERMEAVATAPDQDDADDPAGLSVPAASAAARPEDGLDHAATTAGQGPVSPSLAELMQSLEYGGYRGERY